MAKAFHDTTMVALRNVKVSNISKTSHDAAMAVIRNTKASKDIKKMSIKDKVRQIFAKPASQKAEKSETHGFFKPMTKQDHGSETKRIRGMKASGTGTYSRNEDTVTDAVQAVLEAHTKMQARIDESSKDKKAAFLKPVADVERQVKAAPNMYWNSSTHPKDVDKAKDRHARKLSLAKKVYKRYKTQKEDHVEEGEVILARSKFRDKTTRDMVAGATDKGTAAFPKQGKVHSHFDAKAVRDRKKDKPMGEEKKSEEKTVETLADKYAKVLSSMARDASHGLNSEADTGYKKTGHPSIDNFLQSDKDKAELTAIKKHAAKTDAENTAGQKEFYKKNEKNIPARSGRFGR